MEAAEHKAIAHFRKVDPKLYAAWKDVRHLGSLEPKPTYYDTDHFAGLCRIIVGQQLSGKAADAIWKRLVSHFRPKKINAKNILASDTKTLRSIGMSYAKVRSLHDLSQKVTAKELAFKHIVVLDDAAVGTALLSVRGVGPWTVEMFLMFSLGRPDVFSYGDLGLQKGIQKMYGLKQKPTEQKLDRLTKKWSPYRTYAAQILWRHVDAP